MGRKTSLTKQGTLFGTQEEREFVWSLGGRSGFTGRVHSGGSYVQGEDTKGQSSFRTEWPVLCKITRRAFSSALLAIGGLKKALE